MMPGERQSPGRSQCSSVLKPDQVTVASTSRCSDLTATNAALCSGRIRSHDTASRECIEGGEHEDTGAGYGNGMGMKGKLREEYRASCVSTGLGP